MNNRIKILFSIPNFITAGSGREMVNIIERLDPEGFQVLVHVRQSGGMLHQELEAKGYEVLVRDTNYSILNIGGFLKFVNDTIFFLKLGIKIWQSFDWSSNFTEALIAKAAGSKFVYLKKNMNHGRRAWDLKYRFSDWIIARNSVMMSTILKNYRYKVSLIPGAVNTSVFFPSDIKFERSNDRINVVCVAQLVRVKGQDLLIRAVSMFPEMHLSIIGAYRDEQYRKELELLIIQLGVSDRIELIGSRSDIPDLLKASDIFVLPTSKYGGHEEGSPVALLEAMSTGLICIGSNVAGTSDILIDGLNGFLFEADDIDSLFETLKMAKESVNDINIKRNAWTTIMNSHQLEQEAIQFENTYKNLIK